MTSSIWRCMFMIAGVAWFVPIQSADSEFPAWLGGKPNVVIQEGRCGVYEWFFDEADSQTEGMASKDDLASKRVINIANKLVDHHLADPSGRYNADVRFLVFGEQGSFHFEFHINHEEFERLLNKDCGS